MHWSDALNYFNGFSFLLRYTSSDILDMTSEDLSRPLGNVGGLPEPNNVGDSIQWDGEAWVAGPGGGDLPAYATYVSNSGDDDTGRPNSRSKPYRSLAAALDAVLDDTCIIVLPGAYECLSNLYRNGVSWYFHRGATVLVTGVTMFDNNQEGASRDVEILGYGEFVLIGMEGIQSQLIRHAHQSLVFECTSIYSDSPRVVMSMECDLDKTISILIRKELRHMVENGSMPAIYLHDTFNAVVNAALMTTPGSIAIKALSGDSDNTLHVNCGRIVSYRGIYGNIGVYSVGRCDGASEGVTLTHDDLEVPVKSTVKLTGMYTSVSDVDFGAVCLLDGYAERVYVGHADTVISGGMALIIIVDAGSVTQMTCGSSLTEAPSMTINAGRSDVVFSKRGNYPSVELNGGELTIRAENTIPSVNTSGINVNSGRLHMRGHFELADMPYFIHVTSGVLNLNDSRIYMRGTSDAYSNVAIIMDIDSTLMSNGAALLCYREYAQPIQVTDVNNAFIMMPGGLNSNVIDNNITGVGRQMYKITVINPGQPVSYRLTSAPLETTVTFQENDVETNDTAAKMAQALVNTTQANITVGADVTQKNTGVDQYFYLGVDPADGIVLDEAVNVSITLYRSAGLEINNVSGFGGFDTNEAYGW